MMRLWWAIIAVLLMVSQVGARPVIWDLAGVTDEGGWSSYNGDKVAIALFINGVEVARFWDNPASRTVDIPLVLPRYYLLTGRLYYYGSPYPVNPDNNGAVIEPWESNYSPNYRHRYRLMADNSSADIKQNRVKGAGLVRFGPTK